METARYSHLSPLTHGAQNNKIILSVLQRCVEEVLVEPLVPYSEVYFHGQISELYLSRDVSTVTSLMFKEPRTIRRSAVKQQHALHRQHKHLEHTRHIQNIHRNKYTTNDEFNARPTQDSRLSYHIESSESVDLRNLRAANGLSASMYSTCGVGGTIRTQELYSFTIHSITSYVVSLLT